MNTAIIRSAWAFAVVGFATTALAMTPTPAYLAKAGAGDLYETQSSKLVLQTTKDAKVRAFATKMIADHKQSTDMTVAAAKASGLTVSPPMLDPEQKK